MAESLKGQVCFVTSCSWPHTQLHNIQKTIITSNFSNNKLEDAADIMDMVSFETSQMFCKDLAEEPFEFALKFNGCVRNVEISSEGKVIEVFGKNGEYLTTCHAEFYCTMEELDVYVGKISLARCVDAISLRFVKVPESNQLAIYGILVEIEPLAAVPEPTPAVHSNMISDLPLQVKMLSEQLHRISAGKSFQEASGSRHPENIRNMTMLDGVDVGPAPPSGECDCNKRFDDLEEKLKLRFDEIENKIKKNHEDVMAMLERMYVSRCGENQ